MFLNIRPFDTTRVRFSPQEGSGGVSAPAAEGQPQAGDGDEQQQNTQSAGEAQDVKSLPAWAQTLISNTRAEAAANRRKANEYEKARQDAEEQRLKEQNRWEELAKQYKDDLDRLQAERAKAERDAMMGRVALKHSLPSDLASRLVGDTEEELDADAARLAKLIVPSAPNTETGRAGAQKPAPLTQDEIIRRKRKSGDYAGI